MARHAAVEKRCLVSLFFVSSGSPFITPQLLTGNQTPRECLQYVFVKCDICVFHFQQDNHIIIITVSEQHL